MHTLRGAAVFAIAVLAFPACHVGELLSEPGTGTPVAPGGVRRLDLLAGDTQIDSVAATLPTPYEVRVLDEAGDPVVGAEVTWSVLDGGGSVSPTRVTTDAVGIARATHTLGTVLGWQRVRAIVVGATGSPTTFASFARHASPYALQYEVNVSDVAMGQPIAPAFRILLRDRFGNVTDGVSGTAVVELVEGKGTSFATLSGTLTVSVTNGRAVFDDVRVSLVGSGYQVRVRAAGRSGESDEFDVVLLP